MSFQMRTSPPAYNNKYYISNEYGGYNRCIIINKISGSVLPNCVGYAYGRFMECGNVKSCKLPRLNAENWWSYDEVYARGQTPKLGAVICWQKGKVGNATDGAGHVGIVEKITDTEVSVSMSNYGGTRWFMRVFKRGKYDYNGLDFQGFIYNPYVVIPSKSVEEVAIEVIEGKWGNSPQRKKRLSEAGYNYSEVQAKVNELLKKKLEVGTTVKTIKTGKASSNGTGANAKRNVTGIIQRIIPDAKYSYLVYRNNSPVGWYKAEGLEVV